jgi:hypothetical protein
MLKTDGTILLSFILTLFVTVTLSSLTLATARFSAIFTELLYSDVPLFVRAALWGDVWMPLIAGLSWIPTI